MEKKKQNTITEEIQLKNGINAKLNGKEVLIEKNNQIIKRGLSPIIEISLNEDKIILKTRRFGRREKRMLGSAAAHLKNAINGLDKPFKYKLKIANVHFPMTVSHDKTNNEIVVKNFLGEKVDRRIKVMDNVKVSIDKDSIELESPDIEKAGQTAANIEKGTKVRFRDRRIFQDGIFISEKPGRVFA
jgi:large subunit ribosomal protein L6